MNKQTEALKMAIEALDTLMMEKGSIYQQALNACKEALEQPAQEQMSGKTGQLKPVAWQWLKSGVMRKKIPKDAFHEHWRPLYTHPHQWQGLTDDEINRVCLEMFETLAVQGDLEFCYAIEQALKEKNFD